MGICNTGMNLEKQTPFFLWGDDLFRESGRVRRQEPCESQFIEWKTFDDHLYLFLRKI